MTKAETLKKLRDMTADVNETEIRSHEGESLGMWSSIWRNEMKRLLDSLEGNPETVSHDEKYILEGCIDLMDRLVDQFCEYLDFIGIDVEDTDPDELPSFGFTPFEIVNTLFLRYTSHSGGTSTREKCKELGIKDATRTIWFDTTDKKAKEWLWENERED